MLTQVKNSSFVQNATVEPDEALDGQEIDFNDITSDVKISAHRLRIRLWFYDRTAMSTADSLPKEPNAHDIIEK